jgi:hypothetical protein
LRQPAHRVQVATAMRRAIEAYFGAHSGDAVGQAARDAVGAGLGG